MWLVAFELESAHSKQFHHHRKFCWNKAGLDQCILSINSTCQATGCEAENGRWRAHWATVRGPESAILQLCDFGPLCITVLSPCEMGTIRMILFTGWDGRLE